MATVWWICEGACRETELAFIDTLRPPIAALARGGYNAVLSAGGDW